MADWTEKDVNAIKKWDEKDGVWRMVSGRRVFIHKRQSLTDAIRESGKFHCDNSGQLLSSITQSYTQKRNQINIQLFAANYSNQTDEQLKKSRKSHEKIIEKHKYKIAHPKEFYKDWDEFTKEHQDGCLYQWQKEIRNFIHQIDLIDKEFAKRKK